MFCHTLDRSWIESTEAIMEGRYLQFDAPHGLQTPPEEIKEMRELTQSCALDGTLEGGERFRLGPDWWVRVVNTPGHTYGHIALFDERSRTLLAGEAALWHAILDVNDRPVLPPTYCYVDTYLQTIDRLLDSRWRSIRRRIGPSTATRRISALSCAKAANIVSSWRSSCCANGRERGRFTLREALQELAPRVRRWDESGDGLLTFPFCGNLARLSQRGLLVEGRDQAGIVE